MLLRSHDLDDSPDIVLRRELLPGGRSRAFINDSPVTLDLMTEISSLLIDVHQQFETLEIQQTQQQYLVLDAYCGILELSAEYGKAFDEYLKLKADLASLKEKQSASLKEKDYLQFQLDELDAFQMKPGEISALEQEFKMQSGAEEIKTLLSAIGELLIGERGLPDQLRLHVRSLVKHAQGNTQLTDYTQRLEGILDACRDLAHDLATFEESIEPNQKRKVQLEEILNAIHKVMLKHGVRDEQQLAEVRNAFSKQLVGLSNLDTDIELCEKRIATLSISLEEKAARISAARHKRAGKLAQQVSKGLKELAMKHAELIIEITNAPQLHPNGKDLVEFLFKPNLGSDPKPIRKVASGGELSRLNLCLKSVISDQMELPTLVFDEIDAGVSGEVAVRMGQQLKTLAKRHQVIMITHSPQIAAQAGHHLQVSKTDIRGRSVARIRELLPEDRVTEIAKMLSGDPPTGAAILNARTLIQN
jgi:DNA repair protein RecN (Recombination protein N)